MSVSETKACRDRKKIKAHNALVAYAHKLLVVVQVFGDLSLSDVPRDHPAVPLLENETLTLDAITKEPLWCGGSHGSLYNMYEKKKKAPTWLLVVCEAVTLSVPFAETISASIGVHRLALTSSESLWKLVMAEVRAPRDFPTIGIIFPTGGEMIATLYGTQALGDALGKAVALSIDYRASLMPSMQELLLVGDKDLQLRVARSQHITTVPHVLLHTSALTALTGTERKRWWERASQSLREQLKAHPILGDPDELTEIMVLKPISGGSKENFVFGTIGRLEAHVEQLEEKVHAWILQPFIKGFAWREYRVFLSGDAPPMLVYASRGDDKMGDWATVAVTAGKFYNSRMDSSGQEDEGGVEHRIAAPWDAPVLYDALISFAKKVRDAFTAGVDGFDCLESVLCRVDILCQLAVHRREGTYVVYDTEAPPFLFFNELDHMGTCCPLVDLFYPCRDSLMGLVGEGGHPRIRRGSLPFQIEWPKQLCRAIVKRMLSDDDYKQITWSRQNR